MLEAVGNVRLKGPNWNISAARMLLSEKQGLLLEGSPWVKLNTESAFMQGPQMRFYRTGETLLLSGPGPKKMCFLARIPKGNAGGQPHPHAQPSQTPAKPSPRQRVILITRGDITVDMSARRLCCLWPATIASPQWRVKTRKLLMSWSEKTNEVITALCWELVTLIGEQATAHGNVATWDISTDSITVTGLPYAVVQTKQSISLNQVLTISENWTRISAHNPRSGLRGKTIVRTERK
jgi:hypothetical protein